MNAACAAVRNSKSVQLSAGTTMYHVQQLGDGCVIHVEGNIDIASSPALEAAIALAEESGERRIILSLQHCRYCDSTALNVFVRAKKRLGSRFFVVVPSTNKLMQRIFQVTGLGKALSVHASLEDVLEMPLAS